LDALRVINKLAAQQNGQEGEGEFALPLLPQPFHIVSHPSPDAMYSKVSYSPLHTTPSDSQKNFDVQTPPAPILLTNVNHANDNFFAGKSESEASGSQTASTTALVPINRDTTNALDDVLQNWQ
jgi:hypothetical protein